MEKEKFKRIINVSNSLLDKKIWHKITLKQILVGLVMIIATTSTTILAFLFIDLIFGFSILLIMITITTILLIKNCLILKILSYFIKYLFSSKIKQVKKIDAYNGLIITKTKKYMFFEINCDPMLGNDDLIEMKINDFVSSISQLTNWSIINSALPYSNLKTNADYINLKIDQWFLNNDQNINNPILQNLFVNKVLTENYLAGANKKNTFLFVLEFEKEVNPAIVLEQINNINRNLAYQNFRFSLVNNETFDFIKNELFLFNKKVAIRKDYIKDLDTKTMYHFFKITDLPSFLEPGYLNFLNDLKDTNFDLTFSINTYSIKSLKKEEKIWENAIKFTEAELNQAFKQKDKIQAEHDYEAILEMTSELVASKSTTQKYELLVCLKANKHKDLYSAKRQIRQILKKQYKFDLDYAGFNQWNLLSYYQRSLLATKAKKRTLRILPNNLIAWSYPFFNGNTYLKHGFYLGTLFNSNPFYFSLNSGKKENNSAIIVGKTGCGKSTFIQYIVKNNMSEQNVTTILLDPKGEYVDNYYIKQMDPKIINLDNTNDLVLNPFDLCANDEYSAKVEFILTFIKIWFDNAWNLSIKNKITKAIELSIVKNNFNIDFIHKTLAKNLKRDDAETELILATLEKILPTGTYNYFTAKSTSNLDLANKLIIFNLQAILLDYSDLNKVKLLLLFKFLKSFIYNKANLNISNNQKIQVIVDEFPAIANPAAPFVVTEFVSMVRLVRSYDASLVLVMQDMVRFKSLDSGSNESLKAIANSVAHKFIMHMNQDQLNIMSEIWGDSVELSQEESQEITMKFNKGDILYLNDANRFYFNSTDPLIHGSSFSDNELVDNVLSAVDNYVSNYKNNKIVIIASMIQKISEFKANENHNN